MNTEWLVKVLGPDSSTEDIRTLTNPHISELFIHLLDHLEAEEARPEISLKEYDNPAWVYKQAHLNGTRRAYQKLRNLFKESKTNG